MSGTRGGPLPHPQQGTFRTDANGHSLPESMSRVYTRDAIPDARHSPQAPFPCWWGINALPLPESTSHVYTRSEVLDRAAPAGGPKPESLPRVYTRDVVSDKGQSHQSVFPVGMASLLGRCQKVSPACTRGTRFQTPAGTTGNRTAERRSRRTVPTPSRGAAAVTWQSMPGYSATPDPLLSAHLWMSASRTSRVLRLGAGRDSR